MVQGYCVKCKQKRDLSDLEVVQNARGGYMAKGTCSSCNGKVSRILSKDDAEKAVKEGAKKSF